jgi:UDPglucose--hexose-1-phosphate uridylyltransferase
MKELARHELRHADGRRLWVYGELHGSLTAPPQSPALPQSPAPPQSPAAPVGIHQRYDAQTATWIAISPARNRRPNVAAAPGPERPSGCPLCPGGPEVPFPYQAAVFENRFPSFVADPPPVAGRPEVAPALGRCEVVLYTPSHTGSLGTLSPDELARVVAIWRDRTTELWADPGHRYVLAFENRGEVVGATISHPHGQIYAFDRVPPLIESRVAALERHRRTSGGCLGCSLAAAGGAAGERLLSGDEHVVTAVPFAPRWPYEVHIRVRRHGVRRLADLQPAEAVSFAAALRDVVTRFDRLFGFELPYMMAILEAPDAPAADDWHLAVEFYPPHRNARQLKVRASVETATGLFINDTQPEETAAALRAVESAPVAESEPPTIVVRLV